MDRKHRFNRFDFNEQATIDQQVEAESDGPLELFVANDHIGLVFDLKTTNFELHRQTPFVDRFEKARSFVLVHFNGTANHIVGYSSGLGEKRMHATLVEHGEG